MNCDFVENKFISSKVISARTIEEFKIQYKLLLDELKEPQGIVYVWKSQAAIPRLKGESSIIYIGKAKNSLYDRYICKINQEANEYWDRFNYIVSTYGDISIEIYKTTNPEITENNFLYQYHQEFLELPPINLKSYNPNLL